MKRTIREMFFWKADHSIQEFGETLERSFAKLGVT